MGFVLAIQSFLRFWVCRCAEVGDLRCGTGCRCWMEMAGKMLPGCRYGCRSGCLAVSLVGCLIGCLAGSQTSSPMM